MKKINILIFTLILLYPLKTKALTNELNMICTPKEVTKNDIITCNITSTVNLGEVSGISANIKLSNNLEYIDFLKDEIWQGDGSGNKIGLYTDKNKKGIFNVGILKVKVKENTLTSNETISLTNIIYSNSFFEEEKLNTVTANINILSNNNYLKELNIDKYNLDFDKTVTEYDITVDASSIKISAIPEDQSSTITGDIGEKALDYGLNTFKINVISSNSTIKTYTLNVTRKDTRSSNNTLASLAIEGLSLGFKENQYDYNISVENEIDTIKIKAVLNDNKSSFVKNYEPRKVNLEEGENVIKIKVSAENGSIKTYTINIIRKSNSNNKITDTLIDGIYIDNNELEKNNNNTYNYIVDYNQTKLNIDVKLKDNNTKLEIIGNDNLQVGENEIIIKVTNEEETKEYKITVIKKDIDEQLDKDNYLKELIIENYTINFNKDTINYKIEIKKETKLNITCIPSSAKATYEIIGNNNLKNNSIIEIKVTSQDNLTRTYKIHITKQKDYLLITIIIEIFIVMTILTYMMIKKKRDQNEKI